MTDKPDRESPEHYWRTSAGMIKTDKPMRERAKHDRYPTPPQLADKAISLISSAYDRDDGSRCFILDIGFGNGVWGDAARKRWKGAAIYGIDIDNELPYPSPSYSGVYREDVRGFAEFQRERYDIVIGNPPYNIMEDCVRVGLEVLKIGGSMIMLGRMEFLASQTRGFGIVRGRKVKAGLWEEFPPDRVYILSERPSFTGDSRTDATEYALYHWIKGHQAATTLSWLRWK